LPVAAIVEGKDVDAEVVEAGEGGYEVGERAIAVGQEEDGEMRVMAAGVGGNPPSGELRVSGFVGTEADRFVGDAGDRWRVGGGAGWVQDELPLPLVEEPAECKVPAEERNKSGEGDCFGEPDGAYDIRWSGLGLAAFAMLGGGAGHWGFFFRL